MSVDMMIRRPAEELYEAFVNPEVISQFWLERSSGRLEVGVPVIWDFIIDGARTEVRVLDLQPGRRIMIAWDEDEVVEFSFHPRSANETVVQVVHTGFGGTADEQVEGALNSTQGFTLMLCSLKAHFELGSGLQFLKDKFPDGPYWPA